MWAMISSCNVLEIDYSLCRLFLKEFIELALTTLDGSWFQEPRTLFGRKSSRGWQLWTGFLTRRCAWPRMLAAGPCSWREAYGLLGLVQLTLLRPWKIYLEILDEVAALSPLFERRDSKLGQAVLVW